MGWLGLDNLEIVATIWTIRVSMICLFGSLTLRLLSPRRLEEMGSEHESESAMMVGAKNLWLLGSFFALLHSLAAMGFYHQWSHTAAFEDTAGQTQAILGVRVGIGIYFNYVFVLIWLADAMWWIGLPKSYVGRAHWINWLVYGFLVFIAVNGTIVFERGIVRWVAAAGLVVLAALAYQRFLRSNQNRE